jgi:tetratricopeptide (TPR) repeat protein
VSKLIASIGVIAASVLVLMISQNAFLDYDDRQIIFLNPDILNFNWSAIWLNSPSIGTYAPLTLSSFALENWFFGMQAWHFHLFNGLIHVFNSYLVGKILCDFFPHHRSTAWFLSLLFLVHPINVEAYAWANQRRHLLSTAFFLLAFYSWKKRDSSWRSLIWVYLFFILGCFSKAMTITLPAVLLVFDVLYRKNWKKSVLQTGPLFLISALFAAIEVIAEKRPLGDKSTAFFSLPENLISSLSFYLRQFIFPGQQRVFYSETNFEIFNIGVASCLLLAAGLFYFKSKDRRTTLFAVLFFLITLFPMLKFVPFGVDSKWNDRYLYLPMFGLLLLLASVLTSFSIQERKWRMIVCSFSFLVLTFFCTLTFFQIKVWANNHSLWQNVLRYEPNNFVAHRILGTVHVEEGDLQQGVYHLEKAAALNKRDRNVFANLAVAYDKVGRDQEAENIYKNLYEKNLADGVILLNYGAFLVEAQKFADAEIVLKKSVSFPEVEAPAQQLLKQLQNLKK